MNIESKKNFHNQQKLFSKDKKMKNNQNSQLFTELTPEEGSNVSGGWGWRPPLYSYTIDNKSGIDINFTFGGRDTVLQAGKTQTYRSFKPNVEVQYDEIIGPGYDLEKATLKAGETTSFDRNGVMLVLTAGGQPNANLTL